MARTINLTPEAALGMWVAILDERVPVVRADRRRFQRLQDAIEGILHRNGVGPQQTVRLADGVDTLELEDAEFELMVSRLEGMESVPPQWSRWTLAAEDALGAAHGGSQ
jgi:hypothetical protein